MDVCIKSLLKRFPSIQTETTVSQVFVVSTGVDGVGMGVAVCMGVDGVSMGVDGMGVDGVVDGVGMGVDGMGVDGVVDGVTFPTGSWRRK